MRRVGGAVESVASGGAACAAGVLPGDRLLTIDGHELSDVLDVAWYEADGPERLSVERDGRVLQLSLDVPGPLGLRFESSLFDGVRQCRNRCDFCFVDQLPPGLRPSLYVKDDDYRLSMLYGNFVTLTNLSDEDVDRIVEQRLSPLYVSWHASDPQVRAAMLGPAEGRARPVLERLIREGITAHFQIVLCPGVNDGEVLEDTLRDLWGLGPGSASVGVVPVGRSNAGRDSGAPAPPGPNAARDVIRALEPWQARGLSARGAAWAWAADEWYVLCGMDFPQEGHYGDYPQIGNGVGLARRFLSGVNRATAKGAKLPAECGTVLCGQAAVAPIADAARRIAERLGPELRVQGVRNRLFGPAVSVTGLLGGKELLDAVSAAGDGAVFVPDIVFEPGGLTLDGVHSDEIRGVDPGRVHVVPSDGVGFVRYLRNRRWFG